MKLHSMLHNLKILISECPGIELENSGSLSRDSTTDLRRHTLISLEIIKYINKHET